MLPRAPLLSVAVPEKVQPVKWHFTRGRIGRAGARRLPPLHGEAEAAALDESQPHSAAVQTLTRSLSPQLHSRSLDLCWNLYGGDVAPLRHRGQGRRDVQLSRRRFGLGNRTNAEVGTVSELSSAAVQNVLSMSQEGDDFDDWDDVCSVEALESAGSGKELCLDDDPEDEDGLAVSQLMDSVLLKSQEVQGLGVVWCPQEVSAVAGGDPAAAASQFAPLSRAPAPPARLRASPSVPAASPPPNRGGLPAACSADWAVARVMQAYGHVSLPVTMSHQAMSHQAMQVRMPTLDDLLGSRHVSGRRLPRLEGSGRMPHTAR